MLSANKLSPQEAWFKSKRQNLLKILFWVSTRVQPADKLGSFKVSAKHAVSSKDQEELPQAARQISHGSGRSTGSPSRGFCTLSFSPVSCLVPVASEVSCPPQELAGGTVQVGPDAGTKRVCLKHGPKQTPSAHYLGVGKVLQVQESCSSTNSSFPPLTQGDRLSPSTQQQEKGHQRSPAGGKGKAFSHFPLRRRN